MKTGVPMVYGHILPHTGRLKGAKLSRQAKLRLAWMDHYNKYGSASLTCRYFGISRSTFYKWKSRYKPQRISSLEDHSRAPKNKRKPTTPTEVVDLIKALRTKNPEYSKYKLSVIAARDHGVVVSPSTVGRIITRYNLVRLPASRRRQRPFRPGLPKTIKPKGLKATGPGQIFEFDAKHLPVFPGSTKRYAFVTVDTFSRAAHIRVSSSISSKQASLAWQAAVEHLGEPEIVVTDHGSENLGQFAARLNSGPTDHLFARVGIPQDKPFVERLIGSFETECLSFGGVADTVAAQQQIANAWLAKYHHYRPHAALNYLTPNEFAAKIKVTEMSTML